MSSSIAYEKTRPKLAPKHRGQMWGWVTGAVSGASAAPADAPEGQSAQPGNLVAIPAAALGLVSPWWSAIGMSLSSAVVVLNALRLRRAGRGA